MTKERKRMSTGWHINNVVTHPDEIPTPAKSSGWHNVSSTRLCHPGDIAPGSIWSGWLMTNAGCHPDDLWCYPISSGWDRVKVGNIAHMVWFAHFLFTDSAYIAHAFQCITISFYRTNVNVMSFHGVTNRPKMTTPSIVWWEGRLLFLEVVTHFWVHDPLFLWSKQLLFQFKIYVVACW